METRLRLLTAGRWQTVPAGDYWLSWQESIDGQTLNGGCPARITSAKVPALNMLPSMPPIPLSRSPHGRGEQDLKMSKAASGVVCVVIMAAVIGGVDYLFFRGRFWERLMVNIGLVLVFAAFFLRFLRQH